MTALLDKPIPTEEAPADPIDAFVMPRPAVGQTVLWYPNGDTNQKPEVMNVLRVGHRNLVVKGAGLPKDSVRHVNDPKLQLSSAQRESGAWDFTDRDKQYGELVGRLTALEIKYAELEDLIAGGKKKKPE